jgi:hypothetical protein
MEPKLSLFLPDVLDADFDGRRIKLSTTLVDMLPLCFVAFNEQVSDISFSEEGRVLLQFVLKDLWQRWQVVKCGGTVKEFVGRVESTLGQLATRLLFVLDFATLSKLDVFALAWTTLATLADQSGYASWEVASLVILPLIWTANSWLGSLSDNVECD